MAARKNILVIAHRGATDSGFPENSLPAFQNVVDENYDGVELDVRLSRDKALVVFHDIRLDRLTDGHGMVRTKTLAELKEVTLKSGYVKAGIPTLEETLEVFRGRNILVNIEIKGEMPMRGKIEDRVIELVQQFKMRKHVIISSFNPLVVKKCQRIDPEIKTGFIYEKRLPKFNQRLAKGLIVDSWHPNHKGVTESVIERARESRCTVFPWTVDDEAEIRRLVELGVDGIITNFPGMTRKVLSRI